MRFEKATGAIFTVVMMLGAAWLLFMGWVIVTLVGWVTSK